MKRRHWVPLLAGLIVLLALPGTVSRFGWEQHHTAVTVLFDSQALEQLGRETGTDWQNWAEDLQRQGLTGLAVREENLERLQNRGVLLWRTRSSARNDPGWTQTYPQPVQDWLRGGDKGVLVALWNEETARWLEERLTACQWDYSICAAGEMTYLLIEGGEELALLPLGIWPETAETARRLGLTLCPVLEIPKKGNTLALARALYEQWDALSCPVLIAWGDRLPGWDEDEDAALGLLKNYLDSGGALSLTEVSQHGGNLALEGKGEILRRFGGSLLRSYFQWDFVSSDYRALGYQDGRQVSFALSRGAAERNCRVLWLRGMTDHETGALVTEQSAYEGLLRQLRLDLHRYGLEIGLPAAGDAVGEGLPLLLRQIISWLLAAGTGCLAAVMLLNGKKSWRTVVTAQLVAVAGGLAAGGWLFATPVLVGEAAFRGVKLAQILPLALFLLLWGRRIWGETRSRTKKFLRENVSGRMLVISWGIAGFGLLLAVIGWYYLMRTGNSGLVSEWELRLRNGLEERLIVRPRFKEFALGLPCLILWCRGQPGRLLQPFLGVGAVIGLTSVTNTFLHCTPLRISLVRTGAGWLLGGVLGMLILLLWRGGRRLLWQRS